MSINAVVGSCITTWTLTQSTFLTAMAGSAVTVLAALVLTQAR